MHRSPRVVVLVRHFPTRTRFVERKVAMLRSRGMPIAVVASKVGSTTLPGVPVRTYASARRRALLRHPLRCISVLVAGLRRYGFGERGLRAGYYAWMLIGLRCDIVHFAFSEVAVARADSLDLLPDLRYVMSCRGSGERVMPLVQEGRAEVLRRLFQRVSLVHCVSSEMVEVVTTLGADPERLFVNRPGVDTAFFTRARPRPSSTEATLVMVGRLDWKKGQDLAVLAVQHLVGRGVPVRLEIIGDGEERAKLTFMIATLGLGDVVTMRGWLSPADVKAALETATLLVLPSLSEGISNAALEAMAMEVPVVASDVGGMDEAIDHGLTGFLVRPLDPVALADAIQGALAHPDLATITRQARKRVVEDFSMDRQADEFEAAYRRVGERTASAG